MIGLIEWSIWYNIKVICIKWYSVGRETYIQYRFKDSDMVTYLWKFMAPAVYQWTYGSPAV